MSEEHRGVPDRAALVEPVETTELVEPVETTPGGHVVSTSSTNDSSSNIERPHPLTPVVQVWIWLVTSALFVARQALESPRDLGDFFTRAPVWAIAFFAMAGLSVARNIWTWWTTRFVVTPAELRVEHRGVEHESKRVAYQRIQSVDVVQPFAARLLGLAQLTIDVGGEQPIKIQYLARTRAVQLRDELLHRAHGRDAPDAPASASALDDSGTNDRVLLSVPPSELILGAVLSHELLALVLSAAIPLVIGLVIKEPLLVGGGVLPILLAIGGFVSRRVIGQWNYTLAETPAGLRITRGLTSLSSETIPVQRVQAIRLHEPVLWRRLRRTRVDLSMLGLGRITTNEDGVGASSIMLPIGRPGDVRTALAAVWPALDLDTIALHPAPASARLLAPLALPWIAYGYDDRVLVMRRGWWTRTTWVMPHARLQSAAASQGPLERRLGVARVEVHTSELAGGVPTTYLTDADARAFVFAEMERAKRARGMDAPASPARLAPTSAATGSASLTPGGGLMGAPSGSNR